MLNLESEGLVPHWVQGALFESSLYALVFDLKDDIRVRGPIHIERFKVPCLYHMNCEETFPHDTVLVKLLCRLYLSEFLEHLVSLSLVIDDLFVGIIQSVDQLLPCFNIFACEFI